MGGIWGGGRGGGGGGGGGGGEGERDREGMKRERGPGTLAITTKPDVIFSLGVFTCSVACPCWLQPAFKEHVSSSHSCGE